MPTSGWAWKPHWLNLLHGGGSGKWKITQDWTKRLICNHGDTQNGWAPPRGTQRRGATVEGELACGLTGHPAWLQLGRDRHFQLLYKEVLRCRINVLDSPGWVWPLWLQCASAVPYLGIIRLPKFASASQMRAVGSKSNQEKQRQIWEAWWNSLDFLSSFILLNPILTCLMEQ